MTIELYQVVGMFFALGTVVFLLPQLSARLPTPYEAKKREFTGRIRLPGDPDAPPLPSRLCENEMSDAEFVEAINAEARAEYAGQAGPQTTKEENAGAFGIASITGEEPAEDAEFEDVLDDEELETLKRAEKIRERQRKRAAALREHGVETEYTNQKQ